MFQNALAKATKYTLPLIMSRKTVAGMCASSIGTAVVLNSDGWIVTAGHILRQWTRLHQETERVGDVQKKRSAIEADAGLTRKEKAAKLAPLIVQKDESERCSMWVGLDKGTTIVESSFFEIDAGGFNDAIDIGVARLDPFDAKLVEEYPVFKNPKKNFEPGASLCKLGFPLNEVTPAWNADKGGFELPPGTLPMPRFPLEGMFTRIAELEILGGA